VLLRSGTTRRETLPLRTFEHTWARSGFWAFVATPPGEWPVTAQAGAVVEAAIGFEQSATPAQALRSYESAHERWPDTLPLAIGGNAAHASGDKRRAVQVFRAAAEKRGSAAAWRQPGHGAAGTGGARCGAGGGAARGERPRLGREGPRDRHRRAVTAGVTRRRSSTRWR
jgi:hypothetical protein